MSGTANRSYESAIARWASVGPYYAMFPVEFAFEIVRQYTNIGDAILDPFSGRGSSIFAAHALGRTGTGIEINPVGWLYGRVKMNPAKKHNVLRLLSALGVGAGLVTDAELDHLPQFFHVCFSRTVLRFLVHARNSLNWKRNKIAATLMVLILVDLHGKEGAALSNQMRQGKAMAPDYSVKWWREHNKIAPDIDPVAFMTKKIEWRYAKGTPNYRNTSIVFGDCLKKLRDLKQARVVAPDGYNLLFTSPPYYGLTNYFYDQWLRLWMLGETVHPTMTGKSQWQKRFASADGYRLLLESAFKSCASLLAPDATIYVRTDARKFTLDTTIDVLQVVFPDKPLRQIVQAVSKPSQTALYGDKNAKPGEVDLILRA